MNDMYLPRFLAASLAQALERFPVVVLTGARQTGKTTLVSRDPRTAGRVYRSLDDYDLLERAEAYPDLVVEEAERLTLDEVQRVPGLLLAVKREVDRERAPGRFLLTGSANLLVMRKISESLAGRAVYLNLWPMTEAEKAGLPASDVWDQLLTSESIDELELPRELAAVEWHVGVLAGGYPPAALADDPGTRSMWFDGYVRTYLERDLQELAAITGLADFRRLMRMAALRIGQVLNQTELGRDAGLKQPTAHRYLNLLETSYQVVRIPAFAVNRTKRLVKSPKLYFTDSGLAAHLAGHHQPGDSPRLAGALLENHLLTELLVWREGRSPRPEILYWRTHSGEEVDFVIEAGQRLLPIEVKQARRLSQGDIKSMSLFLDEYPKLSPFGVVIYGGNERYRAAKNILALPMSAVFTGRP